MNFITVFPFFRNSPLTPKLVQSRKSLRRRAQLDRGYHHAGLQRSQLRHVREKGNIKAFCRVRNASIISHKEMQILPKALWLWLCPDMWQSYTALFLLILHFVLQMSYIFVERCELLTERALYKCMLLLLSLSLSLFLLLLLLLKHSPGNITLIFACVLLLLLLLWRWNVDQVHWSCYSKVAQ